MSNVVWRRQREECPFRDEERCEVKPCTNYTFDKHGDTIPGEAIPGQFWCRSDNCPRDVAIRAGVSNRELWDAYMNKKIRFRVDSQGNPTTVIMKTGRVVRSENFTKEMYEEAVRVDPPMRTAGGLGPKIRGRKSERKRKYY